MALLASTASAHQPPTLDDVAERYVKSVLALGQHDADYVDAFYGPAEWRAEAEKAKRPLADVLQGAKSLLTEVEVAGPASGDELVALRREYLRRQLSALVARAEMLQGRKLSFDEESQALYDAVVPPLAEADFEKTLAELGALLPGKEPVAQRYDAFRQRFLIPREKLDAVFQASIDECRRRTLAQTPLPAQETFTVEYVKDKSWSAYNWYKGGYRSVIQVNTDLPVAIDRAIDLACHEGYPGHHVYNALLEKHLVKDRGFVEFTVYPLFSPQSLIAEGTANYGIDVAFPGAERAAFERDRLFPLAGLDAKEAERYRKVQDLVARLDHARTEAARRYLDGRLDAEGAVAFLQKYALQSPDRARQQLRFFDQYRSYIINYNHGQDLVRRYIESRGGIADQPQRRWDEFKRLLASPRLPGGLEVGTSTTADEAALRQVEDRIVRAILERDAAALGEVLARDFVHTGRGEADVAKGPFIAAIVDAPYRIEELGVEDVKVRVLGDAALLTGVQRGRVRLPDGQVAPSLGAFADLFTRAGSGWLLRHAWSVELPAEAGSVSTEAP